jgi:hypothetical protein
MTHEQRTAHWRTIVEKHTASGLSAVEFCSEQQIKVSQFYRWHRKFRNSDDPARGSTGFLQLVPCRKENGSGIRIRYPSGLCIEVEQDFDPMTLRRAIQALSPAL